MWRGRWTQWLRHIHLSLTVALERAYDFSTPQTPVIQTSGRLLMRPGRVLYRALADHPVVGGGVAVFGLAGAPLGETGAAGPRPLAWEEQP
jgi:hypothetical protein